MFSDFPVLYKFSIAPRATIIEDAITKAASPSSNSTDRNYPAMTREEIESWMDHVPVFALTNSAKARVVHKLDNDTFVSNFFLNRLQAEATLAQLKLANAEMDVRVSESSLGKIWFSLLHPDANKEVTQKLPVANKDGDGPDAATEFTTTIRVETRLVPDTRDVMYARILLTVNPDEAGKIKESARMTAEMVQRALLEAPKFNTTYNEIPLFAIDKMMMLTLPPKQEGKAAASEEEPVALFPVYFSLQNMIAAWRESMKQGGVEPPLTLMSLSEIVEEMSKESPTDWRSVVLVPIFNGDAAIEAAASMSGPTLNDI
jgi:Tic22-like family